MLNIFDPWDFLTPKRRRMLDTGWPGLFREHILPTIPVDKVSRYFDETFGRPTKELYAVLGALVLQQSFDLTDDSLKPFTNSWSISNGIIRSRLQPSMKRSSTSIFLRKQWSASLESNRRSPARPLMKSAKIFLS